MHVTLLQYSLFLVHETDYRRLSRFLKLIHIVLCSSLMPNPKVLKRKRDKRYRDKKKDDPEYRRHRAELQKKYRQQRRASESQREKRHRRKKEKEYMREYRQKKKETVQFELVDLDVHNTLDKSESAKRRERLRRRCKFDILQKKICQLQRTVWRLQKKLLKCSKAQDV